MRVSHQSTCTLCLVPGGRGALHTRVCGRVSATRSVAVTVTVSELVKKRPDGWNVTLFFWRQHAHQQTTLTKPSRNLSKKTSTRESSNDGGCPNNVDQSGCRPHRSGRVLGPRIDGRAPHLPSFRSAGRRVQENPVCLPSAARQLEQATLGLEPSPPST